MQNLLLVEGPLQYTKILEVTWQNGVSDCVVVQSNNEDMSR